MYKSFFGLRENPFNANPDPRYLFLTREIQEALAGLAYGIKNRKGFILLTGEVGTGKTTLLNRLLDWLNLEGVATAYIFNSQLDTSQLFDFMMADFGIPCESRDKSHVLMRLNHWLLQRYRDRKTSVLIVHEAAHEFELDELDPMARPVVRSSEDPSKTVEGLLRSLNHLLEEMGRNNSVTSGAHERKP